MNFQFLHASLLVVPSNLISFEHAWPFFSFILFSIQRCYFVDVGKFLKEIPGCLASSNLSRSLQGRGLFVNLGALGIQRGCFQDDCSHSDHFEATTPAECAKICKKSLGAGSGEVDRNKISLNHRTTSKDMFFF